MSAALYHTYEMPPGNPDDWDAVEDARAHFLAREFAREYLADWDAQHALQRLGCYDEGAVLARKVKALLKHPLVTQQVSSLMEDFGKAANVTQSGVIALLWVEAHDRSWGSCAKGRLSALKQLTELLRPTWQKHEEGMDAEGQGPSVEITCNMPAGYVEQTEGDQG